MKFQSGIRFILKFKLTFNFEIEFKLNVYNAFKCDIGDERIQREASEALESTLNKKVEALRQQRVKLVVSV